MRACAGLLSRSCQRHAWPANHLSTCRRSVTAGESLESDVSLPGDPLASWRRSRWQRTVRCSNDLKCDKEYQHFARQGTCSSSVIIWQADSWQEGISVARFCFHGAQAMSKQCNQDIVLEAIQSICYHMLPWDVTFKDGWHSDFPSIGDCPFFSWIWFLRLMREPCGCWVGNDS